MFLRVLFILAHSINKSHFFYSIIRLGQKNKTKNISAFIQQQKGFTQLLGITHNSEDLS